MKLHVAIAADHGGFSLKQELIRRLGSSLDIIDKGADEFDAHDDYPDYVELVGRAITEGEADRGIIICGSGVGACVAANKIAGIRACVCHDTYSAHQGVEHDDLNVLCLGARVIGVEVATELTVAFLMARFSGDERHIRRLNKVAALERIRVANIQAKTAAPDLAVEDEAEDPDEFEDAEEQASEADEADDSEEGEEEEGEEEEDDNR